MVKTKQVAPGPNPPNCRHHSPDEYDASRFSSKENAKWYARKRIDTVVVEKTLSADLDESFKIRHAYNTLGWGRLLELSGLYYPELVRQFYANIINKGNKGGTSTTDKSIFCMLCMFPRTFFA